DRDKPNGYQRRPSPLLNPSQGIRGAKTSTLGRGQCRSMSSVNLPCHTRKCFVAASYLDGSAARWLSSLVQLQGYGHDFRAWAAHKKLEDFLKMVEERWHDPQEAQKATDAILTLHTRQFKSIREATDAIERLICVPGVRYDPQVLLTSYLRCFPMRLRNQLAGEANINVHNFPSFSKKALDLEAKIGHGHNPTTDGKKKTLPPNWKAKGRIMFVDNDGSTIELDDNFQEGVGSEAGSVEASEGGVVAAVAQKSKVTGRRRGGSRSRSQVDPNAPPWEKAGLTENVWRDRYTRQTCLRCGQYGHNQFKCRNKKVTDKIPPTMGQALGSSHPVGSNVASEPVKMPPEIEGVVAKYPDLFEEPTGVVEREVVHAIEIIPGSSIPKGRIYRMSPGELDELRLQLKELVEKGWIRPSVSPYGSPVLFVPKKKEGTLRMCIDYRGLNVITVKNREPLPRIDNLLERVQGCRYFSKIDLKSGYHQIAIRSEDQHKTAFQTRYDLYEFVVMPFGLCNAPGTFQHVMNRIFHDYLDKFVIVYLDDILIFSKNVKEHVAHLEKVLSLLRQHKFKINGEKCEFGRTRVLYLGHESSAEGLKPDDTKVANIRHFGFKKTAANLLQRFWWPTLMRDANLYVETCQVCQRDKPRTQAPLGLLKPLPISERPGESLSMDFMDTLVTSKSGMRYIYVIVDRFSKFARLVATPATAKTEYVIKMFKENWVRDFALPKSIISYRDVRFTIELWKAAAAEQGTQLQMTSANHPEALNK
ncbi:hypothetical protein CBR_g21907, partial [Chara braunii]